MFRRFIARIIKPIIDERIEEHRCIDAIKAHRKEYADRGVLMPPGLKKLYLQMEREAA